MSEIISCTHKVTLDIAKRDVHMIQVIYGDTANILEVNLCENGKEIPLENATLATITYSNNTFDEMQISEDYKTASVRINANCLKQGLNFAQISIYSGDNGLITADMLTIDCNQKIGGENPSCPNADMPKLKELINQLIQQGIAEGISPEQIADAVANYLAKNPIEETDPNVHEWAKAEEKPTYTAAEVGALSAETLKPAVDLALAQAKANGDFDGADGLTPTIGDNGNWYLGSTDTGKPSRGEKGDKGDKGDTGATGATGAAGAAGKSAYAYAQDGGYTGTEEQFAAKLAKEKFANPYALTFTGAVTGSYDGSEPVTVEIPSGGGGSGGSTAEWQLLGTYTMLVSDRTLRINLSQFNGITHFRIIGKFPKCSNDCGDTCIYFGTTFNQTKQPLNGQNVYAFNLFAECELVDGQLYGFIGAIDGWNWRPVASVAMNSPRDSGKCTNFNIYYTKLVEDSTENTIQIWGY